MSGWIHGPKGLKGAIKFASVLALLREGTLIERDMGSRPLTEAMIASFDAWWKGPLRAESRTNSLCALKKACLLSLASSPASEGIPHFHTQSPRLGRNSPVAHVLHLSPSKVKCALRL